MTGRTDPWTGVSTQVNWLAKKNDNVHFSALVDFIDELSTDAANKIKSIRSKKSAMSIADMFDLQMAMNKLSQFSEMSSGVVGGVNSSISSINRNLKG